MVTRRIPDPKIEGSIPSGSTFSQQEEVDLVGSARVSSNLVDVAFFLVTKVCYFFMAKKTTAMRFELARFRIYLLNLGHAATEHSKNKNYCGVIE